MKKLIFVFFLFLIKNQLLSYPVDLTELPAYVKLGFSNTDCNLNLNDIDPNIFKIIPPNKENRKIQIPDLDFQGITKRNFFEFRRLKKQDFTILFFIEIQKKDFEKIISPAFLFAEIGESWEVYLNNHLIQNKISDIFSYNQKDVIVPIPRDILKEGINNLCIHIKGDPLSKETGFYYGKPYLLTELTEIHLMTRNYLLIFLITIYFSISIYNLLFFIKNFNNKFNLYFSLFSLFLAIYVFIRSSFAQTILQVDSSIIYRLELFSLYLLVPFFGKFIENIVPEKRKITYYLIYISLYHGIIFAIASLVLPVNSLYDLGFLWQISIPIIMLGYIIVIIVLYIDDFKKIRKQMSFMKSLIISLLSSIPGNLLIGTLFIVVLSLIDIYINIFKMQSPGLSNYGFLVFLTGATLRVAYNLLDLLNEIEILNKRLKENIKKLKIAYSKIQVSEKKYRYLFNNTLDILITLDENANITNLNQTFQKMLGFSKEEFLNKHFSELIFKEEKQSHIFDFFSKKLNEFFEIGDLMKMQIPFKSKGDIPFRYFDVFFELIKSETEEKVTKEYLVRAMPVKKNPIISFLKKSYTQLIFNNDLNHIDNIISYITEDLSEFLDEINISMIRVGIREILINAIEHGNLEISNEEKTKFLREGIYQDIIKERLNDPKYKNRKVSVEYKFTESEIIYKITDEGNGFDVYKYLNKKDIHLSDSMHGRGIFIAKNAFDRILYNKKGNSVILVKKIEYNKNENQ